MNAVPDCNDGGATGAGMPLAERSRMLVLAACVVAALTGGTGIVAILSGAHPQQTAAETQHLPATVQAACEECGLIETMRVIEQSRGGDLPPARDPTRKPVTSTGRYETSIRLHDGSSLVIVELTPRTWRFGDRVKVIAGAI